MAVQILRSIAGSLKFRNGSSTKTFFTSILNDAYLCENTRRIRLHDVHENKCHLVCKHLLEQVHCNNPYLIESVLDSKEKCVREKQPENPTAGSVRVLIFQA